MHNARQKLGDSVDNFFEQQRRVAGADDARLYEFIADPLLWIGVKKIDKFVSTSSAKAAAVVAAGIEIVEVTTCRALRAAEPRPSRRRARGGRDQSPGAAQAASRVDRAARRAKTRADATMNRRAGGASC